MPKNIFLRLLPVHPTSVHRTLHQLLELRLKRQKFPFDIGAVDAVRIVRVLSPVLLTGCHRHPAALTAQSERHIRQEKDPYKN